MGTAGGQITLLSLVYFLVVLSVLVMVHELGHFFTAKRLGVKVEKFSFGFGPRLFSIKKDETEYLISLIPLGGYVKMAGDEPGEAKNEPGEFLSKSIADRFKIIFAGPLLNYILAFFIFSGIFMFGSPTMTTEVGSLLKDYPAEKYGLKVGDKILAVNDKAVKYWEDMTAIIHKCTGGPIKLTVESSGSVTEVSINPVVRQTKDIFGKEVKVALLGIAPSQKIDKVKYDFFTSFYMGGKKLLQLTTLTYKAIWSMCIGQLSVKESMTGPIGIFIITGKAAELGLIYIFHLMAILSASLAIFNLLPFPVLDGGHIIFLALEKLRGKPLSLKTQEAITSTGVVLLILLTVFIFYNDMMKFGIFDKMAGAIKR